jgi:RNA polymerase sigma-70 factor (ECF subfamily)
MVETVQVAAVEEEHLLGRLRAGDERAFMELVDSYGPLMLRVALGYVRTPAIAEEVVQDAWMGVLSGLDRFEGRSSLKTWILRILVNRAQTRGAREARCVPFSCVAEFDDGEPAVDAVRFLPADHHQWPGHWSIPPHSWAAMPEEHLLSQETMGIIRRAIRELPPRQRDVLELRDVAGWESDEVCTALGISHGNQRVLLHRARSAIRAVLERHLDSTID